LTFFRLYLDLKLKWNGFLIPLRWKDKNLIGWDFPHQISESSVIGQFLYDLLPVEIEVFNPSKR